MPRTCTILRVFVASPSDVAEERASLEDVIQELNVTLNKTLAVHLELVKRETHTYPSIGPDAQAVINEQIADEYEIFIGIMWGRFGTPTGRAGSGTAEEFYRAYRKYRENPNQIRIMFYFKDVPIAPSEMEPDQLASIKAFQKELGEKGTYYWTYTDTDTFARFVRIHLNLQVQEWGKNWGIQTAEPKKSVSVPEAVTVSIEDQADDEEEGYLDLMVNGQEKFETVSEAMTRMTSSLENLSKRINEHTEELIQARHPGGDVDLKKAKRISNSVAEEMNNFAALMEVEVPIFANSFSSGIETFSRVSTLTKNLRAEKKEDVEKVRETIQEFRSNVSSIKTHMLSFRDTIAGFPRATANLNRARKRTLSILAKLNEEFTTASNLTSEFEKVLDQIATV